MLEFYQKGPQSKELIAQRKNVEKSICVKRCTIYNTLNLTQTPLRF